LDTLVFAGGIGENAAPVRKRICDGLDFLGIVIDENANSGHAPCISTGAEASVAVRVIRTDEEVVIAASTIRLLELGPT
jgi:acetate kinase